uniref:Retrovirus-related Pol polyprotein from transposon TNT 1-94-like beta-barrel domain-containing protein n=1 Tax=Phytophthora ramorum TaxID=164328 RepID=H3GIX7_PHYRM
MSPGQASSDEFPRLIGAENFDVWKARVSAALDGKHLLGFVTKEDYDGVSDDESEDSSVSDMSDVDDTPQSKPADEIDSDAVDYEESDEELKPPSDSGSDNSGEGINTTMKRSDLPEIRPFSRHNTHVRLVKNITTSYAIFQAICKKYEGAAFHGDPYFIQHFLMKIKYEESSDLTEFFLQLENAMKAASEATESVMTDGQKSLYLFHSMPKTWKDDLRVWKGQRKYIPYEELKLSIEAKVREIQAQERYTLAKGTPETCTTKSEQALVAVPDHTALSAQTQTTDRICSYCDRPRHNIRQCRALQKDLRDGRVKAGTVLPENFGFKGGNPKRDHPYNNNSSGRGRGRNYQNRGRQDRSDNQQDRNNRQVRNTRQDSDKSKNRNRSFHQERREVGLIAVAATVTPSISLTAQATVSPEPTWTIDSGCTRHVTHEAQWFTTMNASSGAITVGGKHEIPIEGTGQVEMEIIDSKGLKKTLTLRDVLYAPRLQFSLLSVPAAVKHDFRFSFDRKHCAIQTDERFKIKAMMANHADLYQFQAKPVVKNTALIAASGAKP